jgi:hypothetical protein
MAVLLLFNFALLSPVTDAPSRAATAWRCLACAVYALLGFAMSIFSIPERLFPCKFDIFGASHQLLHFFMLASALHATKVPARS